MGDFAVRVFASLSSFETVLRFNRQAQPDLLVIDIEDAGASVTRVGEFVGNHFVETPVVLLAPEAWTSTAVPSTACIAHRPLDGLKLSVLADFLIRSRRGRREIIRYRDVMLDCERLQCLVLPGEEAVSLPLKEAQLLKLLLAKPGICHSRDEIQAAIWTDVKVTPRTIDSHVSRLRKRLKDAGVAIESVYGGGYILR